MYGCFLFLALSRMDPVRRLYISQHGPLGPSPYGSRGPTRGPRGAHKGPADKCPGGPTRAQPTRAQGGPQGPRGPTSD